MSYYRDEKYLTGKVISKTVTDCRNLIKEQKIKFDTIAVRGSSGMLIGAPLAMLMSKDLIIVRKSGDKSHGSAVEGWGIGQRILLLDDFISTGFTIKHIYKAVITKCDSPEVVGILLYSSYIRGENSYGFKGATVPVYIIPPIRS